MQLNSKNKRIAPKYYKNIPYITFDDIKSFYPAKWVIKFNKAFGNGNTCPIVEENGQSIPAIYYWDYERFADLVDFGKKTYFD